jgi:hypothetical protein
MTHPSARLATEVAEAADAWLRDPRDTGMYTRLVHAVERWRTTTRPTLDQAIDDDPDTDVSDAEVPPRLAQTLTELHQSLRPGP